MNFSIKVLKLIFVSILAINVIAFANLVPFGIWNGTVGLSIDGVGSNNSMVGELSAEIPIGATIEAAYLYSVGTPYPWYDSSPTTVEAYNNSGIKLEGYSIGNYSHLAGAESGRTDIGRWFTGRADVTSIIQALTSASSSSYYLWSVEEGNLNKYIDGEVLAIVYSDPSLPVSSVALLDGGQNTDGEVTNVSFSSLLTDVSDPSFFADLSLGISFSTGVSQVSNISINGNKISSAAGGLDDGMAYEDGSLITVGGIGDDNSNPQDPNTVYTPDDELYTIKPFLRNGDAGFTIGTDNPSDDDNIFFMGLHIAAPIGSINNVPEPSSIMLLLIGLGALVIFFRRKPDQLRLNL